MIAFSRSLAAALGHIFFPSICRGCGSDSISKGHSLCSACVANLPYTGFALKPDNPVEKTFYGRIRLRAAMSLLYFTPTSLTQHLVHQFKYEGQQNLAIYLGKMMGRAMQDSGRFAGLDAIVPLPLHRARLIQRGYNQAALLAEGIASTLAVPLLANAIYREKATQTQTHRSREERWVNVNGLFRLNPGSLKGNILLVDDVITTGATIDACASLINSVPRTTLSIATLAIAMK